MDIKFKDRIIIKGFLNGTIDHTTPKAICVHFDGKNPKTNVWIPKKIIEIVESKNITLHYRDITEFNISLPQWFLDTFEMRLVKKKELYAVEYNLNEEEPRTECCDAKFIAETDLCSDCKEHTTEI